MENVKAKKTEITKKDLLLDKETILNHKFSKALTGYDPIEVDMFFDQIIVDYDTYESLLEISNTKAKELEAKIKEVTSELEAIKTELLNTQNELNKSK